MERHSVEAIFRELGAAKGRYLVVVAPGVTATFIGLQWLEDAARMVRHLSDRRDPPQA